jgi:hypothetical protein
LKLLLILQAKQFLVEEQFENIERAVTGVVLADGTVVRAKQVLSNATPAVTFLKLMPDDILPDEFMTGVRCIDYKSVCSLILLLSSLVMSPPVGQE